MAILTGEKKHYPLMECGCAAQGEDSKGNPVCVVHAEIKQGWNKVAEKQPNLKGRKAKCAYGDHGETESNLGLAFFEFHPADKLDVYYCGCRGWD